MKLSRVPKAMGYDTLKPEQKKSVSEFVDGRDIFVSLSTGFGKVSAMVAYL